MKRLASIEDDMKGVVTYELAGGKRVCLDADTVREHGAGEVLRFMGLGHMVPTERAAVTQFGQRIGSVPGDFDPLSIKSRNPFYDPRPGDFYRDGEAWVASRTLGPGDLECVPGFRWD